MRTLAVNFLCNPFLPFLAAVLILPACGWSDDRADELYWQKTYEDVPADKQKRNQNEDSIEEKKESVKQTPGLQNDAADSSESLTLHRCFALALRNSEQLRKQAEQIFQQEAREREIISTILPQVTGIGEYTQDSDTVPFGSTPQDRFEVYFTAKQTLFSGEYVPKKNINQHAQKIETLRLKKKRNQLLFQVASEFYRILQIEADIEALEAALNSAEEFVNVVEARRDAGVASRDELLLSRARRNEVKSTLTNRRYDRRQARARLAEWLSTRSLPQNLTDDYTVQWKDLSVPMLVRKSKKKNPDLRIARTSVKQAQSQKNQVKTEYLPEIDATFTHHTNRKGAFNRFLDWTFFVQGRWKLFDGGGREARMAKAHSRIREARLERSDLQDQLYREIREATLAYQSLEGTLDLLRGRMENAREASEVVSSRYEAGEATNLDVLRAEETAEDAARNHARTQLARKLAALRIHFATGTMQNADPVRRMFQK